MAAWMQRLNNSLHKYMALPAIVLFCVFFAYPLLQVINISFTNWTGFSNNYHYIGFANFINFFSDSRAVNALKVTLIFGLVSSVLLCCFGLIYALILDQKFKGRIVIRTAVYMPVIVSPLIMGYIWLIILSPDNGALLQILKSFHMESLYENWLGDRNMALWAIIALNLWQYIGAPMIIFLAGLQSIPSELYEAGKIDGAGYYSMLKYVTLPLLMPAIRINIIITIINSLAVFDFIVSLTNGGPGYWTESLSMYIMKSSFDGHTGYATAVAAIMFFIVLIPVALSLRLMKKSSED